MTDSILLQNIDPDGLKSLIQEAVRVELASLSGKKEDKFFTRAEVAEKLHISFPTLDNNIRKGRLKAVRIGGRVLIRESDLILNEIPIRKHR